MVRAMVISGSILAMTDSISKQTLKGLGFSSCWLSVVWVGGWLWAADYRRNKVQNRSRLWFVSLINSKLSIQFLLSHNISPPHKQPLHIHHPHHHHHHHPHHEHHYPYRTHRTTTAHPPNQTKKHKFTSNRTYLGPNQTKNN
uniref:Uncharacterized protein n=1 Tax=Helianthus annuus TaxID=4232 RepID=A0A251VCP9_HELAN